MIANVTHINASALNAGIATMWSAREFSEKGGLILIRRERSRPLFVAPLTTSTRS